MRKINRLLGLLSFILLMNHVQAKAQKDTYNNPYYQVFTPIRLFVELGMIITW